MGSTTTIRYDSYPELDRPILIEGLPGIGNVGKITADFLCEKLGGKKFASVYSESVPPLVMLDNDCVVHMACNELWYVKDVNGKDIVFLRGNYQGSTPEGQYLQTRYQQYLQTSQQDLQKLSSAKMQTISEKLGKVVKEVGVAGGYVYIMDITSGIPYISETLSTDVTSQIKTKLGLK